MIKNSPYVVLMEVLGLGEEARRPQQLQLDADLQPTTF